MDPDGTGQLSPTCLLHLSDNRARICFVAAARVNTETHDSLFKRLLASGVPNSHWPKQTPWLNLA